MITMTLQLCIILVITMCLAQIVFTTNYSDDLSGYEAEGINPEQMTKRVKYHYRNTRGDEVSKKDDDDDTSIRGQPKDDYINPLFPPRSDSFWEADDENRVHQSIHTDETSTMSGRSTSTEPQGFGSEKRPNIILILTDDQDIELGSMEYMPETLKVFRDNGIEFRHGYVTTPMCCPSRSSMLTGLYVHNHQVYTNNDNCSSIQWREKFESKTFAAYLQTSGYYTSYIGKYLNKYDGSHIPVGWDEWNGLLMNSRFYNYTVNRNGRNIRYGNNYERDYYPNSISNDTLDFLSRMSIPSVTDNQDAESDEEDLVLMEDEVDEGSGALPKIVKKKFRKLNQPFLLVVSFPSPHGPEDSAPQYSKLFLNETSHHTPAYNFAPNSDKQWILQVTTKMNSNLKDYTNLLMSKRLQTLQSVDVAVKNIFETLKSTGLEDDTYIFYTSDHGYHVGQFGLIKGKSMPYEFDIRVPFFLKPPPDLVRGGTMILEPVLNIDLAPTFLELGGVPIPNDMDGRSMIPLIQKYSQSHSSTFSQTFQWTEIFLIESSGRRESSDGVNATPLKQQTTVGPRMHTFVSEDERDQINELCDLHPHPCVRGQKKYCRKENERVRFRKCRNGIDFLMTITEEEKFSHCDCLARSKRNVPENKIKIMDFDWEFERRKIDAEIEALKIRIDELREKKRQLRQQWISTSTQSYTTKITEKISNQENESGIEGKSPRLKKKNQIHISILHNPKPTRVQILDTTEISKVTTSSPPSTPLPIQNNISEEEILHIVDGLELESSIRFLHEETMTTPPTFHSDEQEDVDEDEEDVLISENSNVLLNTTATYNRKDIRRNRNRGQDMIGSHGFSLKVTKHQWNEENGGEECNCSTHLNDPRSLQQRERDERKRKKLMSKLRKKQRFLNRIRDPNERHQAETCGAEDKMNCFWHDKQHWRTSPLWDGESFCFCMNSNNNTFSCLRSINSTHNYIYCHFITGFKMYFDLGRDPFQLRNSVGNLSTNEEEWMIQTLLQLKQCQGQRECRNVEGTTKSTFIVNNSTSLVSVGNDDSLEPSIWEKIFGTFKRKRNRNGRQRKLQYKE